MKTVAFMNNKGGVGKTSLVYHLAWMYNDLGVPVLAADLDPQANLTAMFLSDDRLEEVFAQDDPGSIYSTLEPLLEGTGDIAAPRVESIAPLLHLVAGDLRLSLAEDELSSQWPLCLDGKQRAFRVVSALWRALARAHESVEADLVLIDVGPNLGALNRAALVSADCVAVPLAPDLYSLQGLRNLGPTLQRWRAEWQARLEKTPDPSIPLPAGRMDPIGYVLMQHAVRLDRPVQAYGRWMSRIPRQYRESMLAVDDESEVPADVASDPACLATLKHYRSLMPMAQEARKPMFLLRSADGAIGGHYAAVRDCYKDFDELAREVASRVGVSITPPDGGARS
jgi:chromosome partitioning protein